MGREEMRELITSTMKEQLEHLPEYQHCAARDLTDDQIAVLTRVVRTVDGFAMIVGRTIVISLVLGLLSLIGLGFWSKIKGGP